MLKRLFAAALALSLVAAAASQKSEKPQAPPPPLKLKAGDTAPDFSLLAFDGKALKRISLRDYRGKKNVVLAFFVFAFTPG